MKNIKTKKGLYLIISAFILFAFFVAARLLSAEDAWICKDGQWVKHGTPNSAEPTTACPTS